MRPIKFRGKRIDNGEWVYGYYFITPLTDEATDSKPEDGWVFLTGRQRHCISKDGCVYEVIPETVGQFTGLHDKNGVEIYEGDLATHKYIDNRITHSVIEYYRYGWCAKSLENPSIQVTGYMDLANCEDIKVIGNIHEERSET